MITTVAARDMGYEIIIFSMASLAPAYAAIRGTMLRLKEGGVTKILKEHTLKIFFSVCGLEDGMEIDQKVRGDMEAV